MTDTYENLVNRNWSYRKIGTNLKDYPKWPDKDRAAIIATTVDILIGGELAGMEQTIVTKLGSIESKLDDLTSVAKAILKEIQLANKNSGK
ncbi:MAG: hypothetical protein F4092_13115 [Rhodospirillaceae bacterium]|nr:hypothetical protein [Gemmatimonadota bacterium]MYJ72677.1 hypothetical protein [Rhodospirillaceae bacterium]